MSLPERLGRLQRMHRLGAGAFAAVWLYHDPELDSPVAVKALADNWSQHADIRERFLAEARILRRAENDHIVRVYDIGEADETPYFVMTYADRGTLGATLAPGRPAVPYLAAEQLAEAGIGLDALHRHGIIHRDIKPNNLLLRADPDGTSRVLVADLGVAKAVNSSGITQVVGTPAYMAPEQAAGTGLDNRADVYALGAVAYQMMTGRQARTAAPEDIFRRPPPPSHHVELSPDLDAVILRALEPDPDHRWPDALSFTRELSRAADELRPAVDRGTAIFSLSSEDSIPTQQITPHPLPRPTTNRGSTAVAIAVVVFVLVASFATAYTVVSLLRS